MNTKTCKGCGWEFPLETPYNNCPFCHREFSVGTCSVCGELVDDIVPGKGKKCYKCFRAYVNKLCKSDQHSEYRSERHQQQRADKDRQLKEWVEATNAANTHPLTEEEWLEACRHFNGCALCGNESIDARGYFIPFKLGGKYVASNVIPLCEKCATSTRLTRNTNPFKSLDKILSRDTLLLNHIKKDALNNIVDYLQPKIGGSTDE